MKHFSDADRRHLHAAEGWLGLGNCVEAFDELENISPELRGHPAVLRVRYQIHAVAKKWESAAAIARAISQLQPEQPFGFIHCAFALHELKRTREALNTLLPVADKFPEQWLISYNLACYTCQLGDLKAAFKWLERAIDVAERQDIRAMALDDPDLEPMWAEIGEL